MKRILLLLRYWSLSFGAAMPNARRIRLYTDSVFGVWPDTTTDFRSGVLNQFYSDTLNLIIPLSAQDISMDYPDITIDSIQLVSVNGLPPGLIDRVQFPNPGFLFLPPGDAGLWLDRRDTYRDRAPST